MGLFNRKKKKEKEIAVQRTDINGTPLEEFSEDDFKDEFFDVAIHPEQVQQSISENAEFDDFVDESFENINFTDNDVIASNNRRDIDLPEINLSSENTVPDDGTSMLEANDISNTFVAFDNVRQQQAQEEFDGIIDTSLDDIVIEDVPYETTNDDQQTINTEEDNDRPSAFVHGQQPKHQLKIDLSAIPNPFVMQESTTHEDVHDASVSNNAENIYENDIDIAEEATDESHTDIENDYINIDFEDDPLVEEETPEIDSKQDVQEENHSDNKKDFDDASYIDDDDFDLFNDSIDDELSFDETTISDELDESELKIHYDDNITTETFTNENETVEPEQNNENNDTSIENAFSSEHLVPEQTTNNNAESGPKEKAVKKAPKKWLGSLAIDDFDQRYNDIFTTSTVESPDTSENIDNQDSNFGKQSKEETEIPNIVEPESLLGIGYEQNNTSTPTVTRTPILITNNEEIFKDTDEVASSENTNQDNDPKQTIATINTIENKEFEDTEKAQVDNEIKEIHEKELEDQQLEPLLVDNTNAEILAEEQSDNETQHSEEPTEDNQTSTAKKEILPILDEFDKKVAKIIDDEDDPDAKELKRIAELQPEQPQDNEQHDELSDLRGAELAAKIKMPSTKRERAITGFFVTMADFDKMNVLLALRNGLLRSGDISRVLNLTLSEANSVLKKLSGDKIITTEKIDGSVYYKINDQTILELIDKAETFIDENDAESRMSRKVKAPVQEKKKTTSRKKKE